MELFYLVVGFFFFAFFIIPIFAILVSTPIILLCRMFGLKWPEETPEERRWREDMDMMFDGL